MLMMKRQSFTNDFKEQALAKVFGRPDDQGIEEVAAGLHMSSGTLKGWMKTATREQKTASRKAVEVKDFTLAEKSLALQETHGMSEEALNGWCRQHASPGSGVQQRVRNVGGEWLRQRDLDTLVLQSQFGA